MYTITSMEITTCSHDEHVPHFHSPEGRPSRLLTWEVLEKMDYCKGIKRDQVPGRVQFHWIGTWFGPWLQVLSCMLVIIIITTSTSDVKTMKVEQGCHVEHVNLVNTIASQPAVYTENLANQPTYRPTDRPTSTTFFFFVVSSIRLLVAGHFIMTGMCLCVSMYFMVTHTHSRWEYTRVPGSRVCVCVSSFSLVEGELWCWSANGRTRPCCLVQVIQPTNRATSHSFNSTPFSQSNWHHRTNTQITTNVATSTLLPCPPSHFHHHHHRANTLKQIYSWKKNTFSYS